MVNHMGMTFAPAVALSFPFVTEDAFTGVAEAVTPVLLGKQESCTVDRATLIALANQVTEMADSDRALSYWLYCVYCTVP